MLKLFLYFCLLSASNTYHLTNKNRKYLAFTE